MNKQKAAWGPYRVSQNFPYPEYLLYFGLAAYKADQPCAIQDTQLSLQNHNEKVRRL